jgi:hypothetical protein
LLASRKQVGSRAPQYALRALHNSLTGRSPTLNAEGLEA